MSYIDSQQLDIQKNILAELRNISNLLMTDNIILHEVIKSHIKCSLLSKDYLREILEELKKENSHD